MAPPYQRLLETVYRRIYGPPFETGEFDWTGADDGNFSKPTEPALPARSTTGLVMLADGVGGLDFCAINLRFVLGSLGSTLEFVVIPWGHGFGRWHADLTSVANRDSWARATAQAISRFRDRNPGKPVFLVGKSGGSGAIVKALEQLPPESVERVILLAPALSPNYDLSAALRAVKREMYVFWSPLDLAILGAGTRIFGTIDRIRSVSAGLVGFRVPPSPSATPGEDPSAGNLEASPEAAYAKLRQVRWRPAMMRTGYFGGHLGPDSPAFLRVYIAPLLRAE